MVSKIVNGKSSYNTIMFKGVGTSKNVSRPTRSELGLHVLLSGSERGFKNVHSASGHRRDDVVAQGSFSQVQSLKWKGDHVQSQHSKCASHLTVYFASQMHVCSLLSQHNLLYFTLFI